MGKRIVPAHEQLEELRRAVGAANMKARAAIVQKEAAEADMRQLSEALVDAYSDDDEELAYQHRVKLQEAEAEFVDLERRAEGAVRRIERARQELNWFLEANRDELIAEREERMRAATDEYVKAAHAHTEAFKAFKAERDEIVFLVNASPGAIARGEDGPPVRSVWEQESEALLKAVRQNPEVAPPLPRWLAQRKREADETVKEAVEGRRQRRRLFWPAEDEKLVEAV